MKKIIILLLVCTLLCSCNKKNYSVPFYVETYEPDMSYYSGITNNNHRFKGTTVSELKRVMDEKGYGPFVFSGRFCDHCQQAMHLLNEVAIEMNVTIYYIDAFSQEYPVQNSDDYDVLFDILYDYLKENKEGEKDIKTPHLFTIIDGEISDSYVGTTWSGLEHTKEDEEKLKDLYRDMLKPFSS